MIEISPVGEGPYRSQVLDKLTRIASIDEQIYGAAGVTLPHIESLTFTGRLTNLSNLSLSYFRNPIYRPVLRLPAGKGPHITERVSQQAGIQALRSLLSDTNVDTLNLILQRYDQFNNRKELFRAVGYVLLIPEDEAASLIAEYEKIPQFLATISLPTGKSVEMRPMGVFESGVAIDVIQGIQPINEAAREVYKQLKPKKEE